VKLRTIKLTRWWAVAVIQAMWVQGVRESLTVMPRSLTMFVVGNETPFCCYNFSCNSSTATKWTQQIYTGKKNKLVSWLFVNNTHENITPYTNIASVSRSGHYQLRQLRPVVRCLSDDATKTLVHAFIASCLDYCKARFLAPRMNCSVACSPYRTLLPGW